MAKNLYAEQKIIKIVGHLNKDENGNFICVVENKDITQEYDLIEILEQMVGTEISLSSINELA